MNATSTTEPTLMAAAAKIRAAAVFCLTHGAALYEGWTAEKLFRYLAFQHLTGGLLLVEEDAGIAALLIAWPDSAEAIRRRDRAGELHFVWQEPMPAAEADAFLLADVIVMPHRPDLVTRLASAATARWPDWKLRKIFTHRRGQLTELTPATLERVAHVRPENS